MSSHHFVKEGQEPSVIVLGDISDWEILGGTLEWSPKVIANNEGYHALSGAGVKVDVCWQDQVGASIAPPPYPLEVLHLDQGIEEHFIQWMREEQQPAYLFGWKEEQIIPFLEKLDPATSKLLTAISPSHKWVSVSGHSFSKWFPEGIQLRCYGRQADWEIAGSFALNWPNIRIIKAGTLSCSSKSFGLLGEPIESFLH